MPDLTLLFFFFCCQESLSAAGVRGILQGIEYFSCKWCLVCVGWNWWVGLPELRFRDLLSDRENGSKTDTLTWGGGGFFFFSLHGGGHSSPCLRRLLRVKGSLAYTRCPRNGR